MNLTPNVKTIRISNAVAAGTSDVTSSAVSMFGVEGVRFIVAFGTITTGAVTSVKVQQSDDDGVADAYGDLDGVTATVPDTASNKLVILEVWRPQKDYLKVLVDRGTQNAVIDVILAELYAPGIAPVIQDSTVSGAGVFVSPDEA